MEVGTLALELGAGRGQGREVEVDLAALARSLLNRREVSRYQVVVGHLAHLLPVSRVVVLRCHPLELDRRLARARRGSPRERRENVAAEATDLILLEALRTKRPLWEVDTTGRSVAAVAREVARILRRPASPRFGRVDWLADPRVTDYLLRPVP